MPISYNAKERVFRLDTPHTTYLCGLAGREGFLGHIYYGPTVPDDNMAYLLRLEERPGTPDSNPRERASFYDCFPFEYPTWGGGNFREPCLRVKTAAGGGNCELFYESHRILSGKPALEGLPAAFGSPGECETLEIILRDPALDLRVRLLYTVFEDVDAICRSVRIENGGREALDLTAALSASLELDNENFDLLTLHGSWAREQAIDRRPLASGKQGAFSLRGISSHQFHPFLALCAHTATQEQGLCYGISLVYSGNFLAQAELDQFDRVRAVLGIHPEGFQWRLEPGGCFQAPETVLVCSVEGLGGMSRSFHDLFRAHLIRGQKKHRPTLLNSWEACYFDFDHDKLLRLGREAARYGIELLVVDDGWFGRRNDETTSLGDWRVNEQKLPGGLKRLGEELAGMGVKLGIWMEPEMISPDSDLYRAHPDYAMALPDRAPTLARNQLVLDLTRREVRDCVYSQITDVLRSAPIRYLKWDMNRPLIDLHSAALPPDRQGETAHRYVLGLNGRVTPFEIRGRVSLSGCFGYELDTGRLSAGEQALIPRQLEEYRQYGPLFRDGDCYRLASYRENHTYDAIMAVAKDKSAAAVRFVQVRSRAYRRSLRLRLAGLEETALYRREDTGEVHTGAGWMRGGLLIQAVQSDYLSVLAVLKRVRNKDGSEREV